MAAEMATTGAIMGWVPLLEIPATYPLVTVAVICLRTSPSSDGVGEETAHNRPPDHPETLQGQVTPPGLRTLSQMNIGIGLLCPPSGVPRDRASLIASFHIRRTVLSRPGREG